MLPKVGKSCTCAAAFSELACLRAYLAAIPCEMMASYSTRLKDSTHYLNDPLTLNNTQLSTNGISVIGYEKPVSAQYCCSSSSIGIGISGLFLKPRIGKDSLTDASRGSTAQGISMLPKSASCVWVSYIPAKPMVAYRASQCTELPVEDPDNSVFGGMKDHVV